MDEKDGAWEMGSTRFYSRNQLFYLDDLDHGDMGQD
tara:strand:- start:43180 stop:43287 length:108 start_codon:yes stop_codon:yes gene_type:complete